MLSYIKSSMFWSGGGGKEGTGRVGNWKLGRGEQAQIRQVMVDKRK